MMVGLTLEHRLLRFLSREAEDEQRASRDLRALPAEDRVLEGECVQGAELLQVDGDRYRFKTSENLSKFRDGDAVLVGDGLSFQDASPLVQAGYDPVACELVLQRDPYQRDAEIELRVGAAYCVDRRPLALGSRLASVVRQAFAEPRLRGLLLGEADPGCDAARHDRGVAALEELGLNPAQVAAGAAAIATDSLALVQGPPGTGKTRLLAEVVGLLADKGCRIVLTAFTHRAVDHALLAIAERYPELPLVKLGRSRQEDAKRLRAAGVRSASGRRPSLPRTGVVAGTAFALARLPEEERFHFTVIDEAGQLPIPHACAGMLRAQRWLLFGDHQQLPPVITAQHRDTEATRSVFGHLHHHYSSYAAADGFRCSHMLDITWRLNRDLCRVIGDTFYGGQLKSAEPIADRRMPFQSGGVVGGPPAGRYDEVLNPEHGAVWLAMQHGHPGPRNAIEAEAVADLVGELVHRHGVPPSEIAVVAPFRAQVREILAAVQTRSLLGGQGGESVRGGAAPSGLVVDTVERIQGQEREVVLVSLAVGDPAALGGRSGFFFSANRMNVALSRARTKAVLVASERVLEALPMDPEALRVACVFRGMCARMHRVDGG